MYVQLYVLMQELICTSNINTVIFHCNILYLLCRVLLLSKQTSGCMPTLLLDCIVKSYASLPGIVCWYFPVLFCILYFVLEFSYLDSVLFSIFKRCSRHGFSFSSKYKSHCCLLWWHVNLVTGLNISYLTL